MSNKPKLLIVDDEPFNIEIVRELLEDEGQYRISSAEDGDIALDIDKLYNFGFAIHDDYTNGRFHHVSLGYKLGFDNAEAEINAVKK